jgi:hypothetical protein
MQQITNWDTFKLYFQEIANTHIDIESFIFGSNEKRANSSRSEITYPCLQLEIPNLKPLGDGAMCNLTSAFIITKNAGQTGDYDTEELCFKECFEIAIDVISKMRADAYNLDDDDNYFLDFTPSDSSLDAGIMMSIDNEVGYRVEFTMRLPQIICYKPEKFGQ